MRTFSLKAAAAPALMTLTPSARVDADRPGDVVLDHLRRGVVADHRQQEIVIAEDGERRLVDDRDVGELEMGVQRGSGRHRRLDDRGEAHLGVEAAGLEGRPAGVGKRRRGRPRPVRGVLFRQQQPRRVHIAAADMGMDVDGAGHDDAAGGVEGPVGSAAGGRLDDLLVAYPEVALAEAAVDRIDDLAAGDPRQHGNAAPAGTCSAIARMIAAADGSSEAARASTAGQRAGAAGIDHRVVVDAGLADRDGDGGARDRPRRLRQRDQCGAVAVSAAAGSRPAEIQRCKSASPAAIIRATSKRQGSNSGKPRAKPVRSGKPVIQVEASVLPQPLSLAGRCRPDARDFRLRSAISPCSISSASPSAAWPENRKTGNRASASALGEAVEIRHRRRDLAPGALRPAARQAWRRDRPRRRTAASPSACRPMAGPASCCRRSGRTRARCRAERSGTVSASSATKP